MATMKRDVAYAGASAMLGLCWTCVAAADNFIGIDTSAAVKGRGEAVISSVTGSDALFYNPAGLAWSPGRLDFLQVRMRYTDPSVRNRQNDEGNQPTMQNGTEQITNMQSALRLLDSEEELAGGYGARAFDLAIPHFGLTSFASHDLGISRSGQEGFQIQQRARVGLMAGFALRWSKLALGVSHYALSQADMNTQLTGDQVTAIQNAVLTDTLAEDTVDWAASSALAFGGTRGTNVGLMYRPREGQPTAIAVSGLNVGGAQFTHESPLQRQDVKQAYEDTKSFAAQNGLELGIPGELSEIWNAGLTWGWTSDSNIVTLSYSANWLDVGRPDQTRLVESAEVGVQLPDTVAMALSVPILPLDDNGNDFMHIGISGFSVYGAASAGRFHTSGAKLSMHVGWAKIVSLIRIDVEANTYTTGRLSSEDVPISEQQYLVGLTWVSW